MRKIIIILAIIFVTVSAQAECYYRDFHIKCTIETIDGKITNGYLIVSMCNLPNLSIYESLLWSDNMEELKKALNQVQQWWKEALKDTLEYYQDRKIYEHYSIAYHLNKKNISLENIKTIMVEELWSVASYEWISSELQSSDTTWVKKEPIKKVEFESEWGFICSHRIFIHAKSEKTDKIIRQLELKWKEIEETENIDKSDEMWKIIEQLQGEKVVVISECTD